MFPYFKYFFFIDILIFSYIFFLGNWYGKRTALSMRFLGILNCDGVLLELCIDIEVSL